MRICVQTLLFFGTLGLASCSQAQDDATKIMLQEIRDMTRMAEPYSGISELDARVYKAMGDTNRADFVPRNSQQFAYENRPLSIGHGQTISQPFIVALMTHLMDVQADDTVLEIGTGSGYQAAILGVLAKSVYTIEIVPELAQSASNRLKDLGYENVAVKAGDGWFGWPEAAPFDKIIITAVADEVPPRLVDQLKPGGLLTMPLGNPSGYQQLVLVTKQADKELDIKTVLSVQFVPMTGAALERTESEQ